MAQRKAPEARRSIFRLSVKFLAAGFALLTARAFAPTLGFDVAVVDAGQSLSISGLIWPATRLFGVLCVAFGVLLAGIDVLLFDS